MGTHASRGAFARCYLAHAKQLAPSHPAGRHAGGRTRHPRDASARCRHRRTGCQQKRMYLCHSNTTLNTQKNLCQPRRRRWSKAERVGEHREHGDAGQPNHVAWILEQGRPSPLPVRDAAAAAPVATVFRSPDAIYPGGASVLHRALSRSECNSTHAQLLCSAHSLRLKAEDHV